MAKFMNAELLSIRDNLACAHCLSIFCGSDSQAWKVKYEKKDVYCSAMFRKAAMQKKFSTPVPDRGPCGTCGNTFQSRTAKMFCGMGCYTSSKMFSDMIAESRKKAMTPESIAKRAESARRGCHVDCLQCGGQFYQKRATAGRPAKKFCGKTCYRSYMANRFDRWMADPQGMALPQCYDEFLDKEELSCIIDGCGWVGKHLSAHVNLSHGFPSADFKRAAGFNLTTGLVSRDTSELMSQRALVGVANLPPDDPMRIFAKNKSAQVISSVGFLYQSKEGCEHRAKSRALAASDVGPSRDCLACGAVFQQSSPFGRTIYCSRECRSRHYSTFGKAKRLAKTTPPTNLKG